MGYTPHVLVVGGGVVGTAIARDLVLRGLEVTLVERGHLASGTTGASPGILEAGTRFAVDDPTRAQRYLQEHRTLSRIAEHCIQETGGLVVGDTTDTREAFERTAEACREGDIPAERLSDAAALQEYPSLSEDIEEALRVPAAVLDPFQLVVANARGAAEYGATIRTHTSVTDVLVSDGSVAGVEVRHDPPPHPPAVPQESTHAAGSAGEASAEAAVEEGEQAVDDSDADPSTDGGETALMGEQEVPGPVSSGDGTPAASTSDKQVPGTTGGSGAGGTESGSGPARSSSGATERSVSASGAREKIRADFVVNAAGPWAPQVAAHAGFDVGGSYRAEGLAVVTGGGPQTIVSRPGGPLGPDADAGDISGVGSFAVPVGDNTVLGTVVDDVPGPEHTLGRTGLVDPLLDDLAGVLPTLEDARPLRTFRGVRFTPDEPSDTTFVDHGARDDCWGMITVTAGTLMTHRLVAEAVTDHVCQQFGIARECQTDEVALPGSEGYMPALEDLEALDLETSVLEHSRRRLGTRTAEVLSPKSPVICDCQGVTRAEVRDAIGDETAHENDVHAVRVRTGASMGTCQGGRCAHRLVGELFPEADADTVADALADLAAERWAGHRETLWGESMAQAMATYRFHVSTLHRNSPVDESIDLEAYDDGPDDTDDGGERRGYGGYPV